MKGINLNEFQIEFLLTLIDKEIDHLKDKVEDNPIAKDDFVYLGVVLLAIGGLMFLYYYNESGNYGSWTTTYQVLTFSYTIGLIAAVFGGIILIYGLVPQKQYRICPKCNLQIEYNMNFCPCCGTKIIS